LNKGIEKVSSTEKEDQDSVLSNCAGETEMNFDPNYIEELDFLPTITIKAKDLANEMTNINIVDKNLKGQDPIAQEHIKSNLAVGKHCLKEILSRKICQPPKT